MRCLPRRHLWAVIEVTGRVTTERCIRCFRTRIRILPAPTTPDHPKESR